jgi:hypothetical protein
LTGASPIVASILLTASSSVVFAFVINFKN